VSNVGGGEAQRLILTLGGEGTAIENPVNVKLEREGEPEEFGGG